MRAFIYATLSAIAFVFFAASIPVAAVIGNSAGLVTLAIAGVAACGVMAIARIKEIERREAYAYMDRCIRTTQAQTRHIDIRV